MAERDMWSSRATFVLAAIGAAIGLGNVWRFPYICYKNGGGAFLIPYAFALLTAGIPLMILEFGLGHRARGAAPVAFRDLIGRKWEWVGWLAALLGFAVVCYYCVIMSWAANYFVYSFDLAYDVASTENFFFTEFLGRGDGPSPLGGLRWPIVFGLIASWTWIYLSIIKGVHSVGKVVWVTVTVPWAILIIFVVRGVTLPGALEGIKFYLTPDFSKLLDPQVWLAAYVQIFFTLSIGWGVMIAYASFLPKDSDIVKNAFVISLANCCTSFVGGFAVFSALGYYAQNLGVPVSEVVKSGPHLAFVTYPTIIALLPFGREAFGALFFLMLLTLAIDSGFSFVEGTAAGFIDKFGISRLKANTALIGLALLVGLLFATRAGYYWLDIVDYFLNSTILVVVGILQCLVVGWVYGARRLREYANGVSDWKAGKWWEFCVRILTPAVLFVTLISALIERAGSSYEGYPRWAEFLGGWLVVLVLILLAFALSAMRGRREAD